MVNKNSNKDEGSSGSETRNRKTNSDKTNQEIQKAWKEFTKDSEKARKEINEAFDIDDDNKEFSASRVGLVVLVVLVVATGVGALIKFLF